MRVLVALLFVMTLSACADRSYTPTTPQALNVGTPYTVFAATSRAQDPNGHFGFERGDKISFLELTVSIPPSHTPGELQFAYANPKPDKQFTMANRREFDTPDDFRDRLAQYQRINDAGKKEVTVFVHGYNATQSETAFRAAQMAYDIGVPGAMIIYSWPSKGQVFGYAYDTDSMLFARDGLEQLLQKIRESGADQIVLIAHSMGSALSMEAIRQAELKEPGWASRTLAGVVLISPDLDVDVFRAQMGAINPVPQPFVVMVSGKDKALNLSGRLRGTADHERLGNLQSITSVADLPIEVIDTTAFSSEAASSHLVAVTSPTLIAMFQDARRLNQTLAPDTRTIGNLLPSTTTYTQSARQITLEPADPG